MQNTACINYIMLNPIICGEKIALNICSIIRTSLHYATLIFDKYKCKIIKIQVKVGHPTSPSSEPRSAPTHVCLLVDLIAKITIFKIFHIVMMKLEAHCDHICESLLWDKLFNLLCNKLKKKISSFEIWPRQGGGSAWASGKNCQHLRLNIYIYIQSRLVW